MTEVSRPTALFDLRKALFIPDTHALAILHVFGCCDVAEQEIAEANRTHRTRRARSLIKRAFLALQPPPCMRDKSTAVYRHHVRELLDRVVRGADLRPGTDAEVLCAILDTSLAAPLTANAALVCGRLAKEVLSFDFGAPFTSEPWPGAVDEVLADVRRRVAVKDRVLR